MEESGTATLGFFPAASCHDRKRQQAAAVQGASHASTLGFVVKISVSSFPSLVRETRKRSEEAPGRGGMNHNNHNEAPSQRPSKPWDAQGLGPPRQRDRENINHSLSPYPTLPYHRSSAPSFPFSPRACMPPPARYRPPQVCGPSAASGKEGSNINPFAALPDRAKARSTTTALSRATTRPAS